MLEKEKKEREIELKNKIEESKQLFEILEPLTQKLEYLNKKRYLLSLIKSCEELRFVFFLILKKRFTKLLLLNRKKVDENLFKEEINEKINEKMIEELVINLKEISSYEQILIENNSVYLLKIILEAKEYSEEKILNYLTKFLLFFEYLIFFIL